MVNEIVRAYEKSKRQTKEFKEYMEALQILVIKMEEKRW